MSDIYTLRKENISNNLGIDIILFNARSLLSQCAATHNFTGEDFYWIREKILTLVPFLVGNLAKNEKFFLYSNTPEKNFKMEVGRNEQLSLRIKYNQGGINDTFNINYKNFSQKVTSINYIQNFNIPFYRFISLDEDNSIVLIPRLGTAKFQLNNYYLTNQLFFSNIVNQSFQGIMRELLLKDFEIVDKHKVNYQCSCTKKDIIDWVSLDVKKVEKLFIDQNLSCLKVSCEYCFHDYFLFKEDISCFENVNTL